MSESTNELPSNPVPVKYENLVVDNLPSELVQDETIAPTLKAYDTAYGLYINKPEPELTDALRVAKPMVKEIIEKVTAGGNRLRHSNRIPSITGGKPFQFSEYLPVDDIVDFLGQELKNFERSLPSNPDLQDKVDEYKALIDQLDRKSSLMSTDLVKRPNRLSARVAQEVTFLKKHAHPAWANRDESDPESIKAANHALTTLAVERVDARTQLKLNPSKKIAEKIKQPQRTPVESPQTGEDPNAASGQNEVNPAEESDSEESEDQGEIVNDESQLGDPLRPMGDIVPPRTEVPPVVVPQSEVEEEILESPETPAAPRFPADRVDEIEADTETEPAVATGTAGAVHADAAVEDHEEDEVELEDEAEPIPLADRRYDMAVVNRTLDVRKRARELAETQLREQLRKPVGYNPMEWAKKAHLRIFEEYYRQQYTERAYGKMIENNNSYLEMDLVRNAITDAQKLHKIREQRESGAAKVEEAKELLKLGIEGHIGIAEQHIQEANPEVRKLFVDHLIKKFLNPIHLSTPEQFTNYTNVTDPERIRLEKEVHGELLLWMSAVDNDHIRETITNDPLKALLAEPAVKQQLNALFGRDATKLNRVANFFASDVIDVVHRIEGDYRAHHFALDQLDSILERTNVTLGNMSWAAESKANFNLADKIVQWSQRGKIRGALLNPASVGAAVSVGSFFALKAPSIAGKMAHILGPGVGGIAGGTVAAFRRSYDLKVDRASHQVDRTYGAQAVTRADVDAQLSGASWMKKRLAEAGGAYRRADLEALAYDTKRADSLVNQIAVSRSLDLTQESNRNILLNQLAEVRARMNFSASQKVDLIQFAGRENVEQQRLELIKTIAEGRKALIDAGLPPAEVRTKLDELSETQQNNFAISTKQKDNAFLRYRIGESLKAGAAGTVVGVAGGLVGEQIITLGRRGAEVLGTVLTGHSLGMNVGETNLEHLIRKTGELARGGKETPTWQPTKLDLEHLYETPGGGNIELSKNLQMSVDSTHHITFIDRSSGQPISIPAGIIKENGDMVFTGKLPDSLKHELQVIHFTVAESTLGVPHPEAPEVSHEGFLPTHADMVTGHKTLIPEGTMWLHDGSKWDLVMINDHSHMVLNDVAFDSHGTITSWDHASGLGASIDAGKFVDSSHEILAPTGEWKEHGVKLDRYEWYSYDKAGSQGNELKLYTYKDGDTVTLSMHDMGKAWQSGLNPREINVPDVYQNLPTPGGHAGYAFSLPGHLKEPIIALSDDKGFLNLNVKDVDPTHFVKYIDTDGITKQMHTAEFSQMVLNYEAYKNLANGNIATELNGRFDVWKVGGKTPGDDFGFISAGRFIDQDGKNVWQSFATIRGKGETSPIIQQIAESAKINLLKSSTALNGFRGGGAGEVIKIATTEVTPPLESVPFAVPFIERYPLDAIIAREIPFTYYYGMSNQLRLQNIRSIPVRQRTTTTGPLSMNLLLPTTGTSPSMTGYYGVSNERRLTENGGVALDMFRDDVRRADNIIMAFPYHMGDSMIALGYMNAVIKKTEALGLGSNYTFIVPNYLLDILKPLERPGINVIPGNQIDNRDKPAYELKSIATAINLINTDPNFKNTVVFDFEDHGREDSEIIQASNNEKSVTMFSAMFLRTYGYGSHDGGNTRYKNFATDLLGDSGRYEPLDMPTIPLPTNHDDLYRDIATRNGVDMSNSNQISINLESGSTGRQYSIEKWVEAAKKVQDAKPDMQINFIVNPRKRPDDPTLVDPARLQAAIAAVGLQQTHIVSGSLQELVSFYNKQKLIMSNDGGTFHLATATESGPKVVGLFLPGFANHWNLNVDKVVPLEAPAGMTDPNMGWSEQDETRKWINKITSQDIATTALATLP